MAATQQQGDPLLAGLPGLPTAATPAPTTPAAPATQPQTDPLLAGLPTTAVPQATPAPSPTTQRKSDPLLTGLSPQPRPNEPWYSKAWDWANTPLIDLHQWDTPDTSGFRKGVEDVLGGLTSPLSLGLTIGTLGTGPALEALGVGARELPVAIQGMRALVDAGFTYQAVAGAVQESPRLLDALKEGNYNEAERLMVNVGAGAGLGIVGAVHGLHDAGALAERTGLVKPSVENDSILREGRTYLGDLQAAGNAGNVTKRQLQQMLPKASDTQLGAIYRMIEAGGNSNIIRERINLLLHGLGREDEHILPEQTLKLHPIGSDAARDASWESYLRNLVDTKPSVAEGQKPTIIVLGGGTASGKSSVLNDMFSKLPGFVKIDTDEFRNQVPEYDELKDTDPWHAAATVHDEASHYSKAALQRALDQRKNIVLDATTSGTDAANRIKQYKDLGYHVKLVFVDIPTGDAIMRAFKRALDSTRPENLGRFVPDWALKDAHFGAPKAWSKIKDLADEAYLFDNNVPKDAKPILVAERLGNQPEKVYNSARYEEYKAKGAGVDSSVSDATPERERRDQAEAEAAARLRARAASLRAGGDNTRAGEFSGGPTPLGGGAQGANAGGVRAGPAGDSGDRGPAGTGTLRMAQGAQGQPLLGLSPDEAARLDAHANHLDQLRDLRDLADRQELKKSYTPAEQEELLRRYKLAYDYARNGMPAQWDPQVASTIRDIYNRHFEIAHAKGVIGSSVDNYMQRLWDLDKDPNNAAANRVIQQARMGNFATNVNMARHRVFGSTLEGELLGKHLLTDNPVELLPHYVNQVRRAVAAREMLERLRDQNTRASDGMPTAVMSGTGETLESPTGGPAVLVNPNQVRGVRIADNVIAGMKTTGDFDRLLADDKIVKIGERLKTLDPREAQAYEKATTLPSDIVRDENGALQRKLPIYAWNGAGYETINHPAFRNWNFAIHDTAGNPVYVKGDLRIHPEQAEMVRRMLGIDKSTLRQTQAGRMALGAGREAKNILLNLSPFHAAQEALRAVMTGVNPIGIEHFDIDRDPVLREGVNHELDLAQDRRALEDYQEGLAGHSKLISKIPVVRDVQDWLQDFLFRRYIPGLKARAFRKLVGDYKSSYPEWSNDKVYTEAARHTNEAFGGINYRALGRSANTQDIFRLAALAPDWLESEMRFAHRLFTPEGKVARTQVLRMAAGLWGAARVLNLLTTGKPHLEAPFGVAHKDAEGNEKIYSVRTLPTDILHLATDPAGFMRGRVSPLGRVGLELYQGRNQYGRKLTPMQTFIDVIRNTAPIPLQAIGAAATGQLPGTTTTPEQVYKSTVGTVQEYRSAAEQKAEDIASDHTEQGPIDREKLGLHQAKMRFEDQLRSGTVRPSDIYSLVEGGQLSVKDAKDIMRNAGETRGMSLDNARLYTRAIRLPMKDFLDVWQVATDEQRSVLAKLLLRKRQSYIRNAIKTETAAQRAADPTYRRLRAIFPNLPPW